ncbi:hypothetical protein QJL41_18665 [Clostridioides difficile]|uniref:hypothetical protein n=1 Tax=Clostridioides difficile TaxID=1496 RepID=UPI00146DF122|nr:hypothetical protein [Clostridioides difficile]MDI3076555.1 hypothetical protein [Clostridioides difficile]MDK3170513.1 hypothetical protein [Clostridioides difficile]NMU17699.1 hypothetical protein [Clostridioides difficile]
MNKLNNEKDNINLELSKKANKEHKHNVSDIEGLTIAANAEDINYTNVKNEEISNSKQALDVLFTDTETSKKSILDIENLVEAENIKCTIDTKEYTIENSKKGYLTNLNIEGKTLVNLANPNNIVITEGLRYLNPFKYIEKEKQYTFINLSNKEIYYFHDNVIKFKMNPDSKTLYTIDIDINDTNCLCIAHSIKGWGETDADKQEFTKSVIILEGDYTSVDIGYFEGIQSVGQGDNIEIISCKEDMSLFDKKVIPYTLRGLPDGTRDGIVYKDGCYKLIQRCEEITLNGQESWILHENSTDTTLLFYASITEGSYNNTNNMNLYCNRFKSGLILFTISDYEGIYETMTGNVYVRILKSKLNTQDLDGFKTWLSSNNVTVIRQIKTKEIKLIDLGLKTFENETRFVTNTGNIIPTINFEVTQNFGSNIEILKNKINTLENIYTYSKIIDLSDKLLNGWKKAYDIHQGLILSKIGNIVQISSVIRDGLFKTGTIIVYLPKDFIPNEISPIQIFDNGESLGSLEIRPEGYIKIAIVNKNSTRIIFNGSYILD